MEGEEHLSGLSNDERGGGRGEEHCLESFGKKGEGRNDDKEVDDRDVTDEEGDAVEEEDDEKK